MNRDTMPPPEVIEISSDSDDGRDVSIRAAPSAVTPARKAAIAQEPAGRAAEKKDKTYRIAHLAAIYLYLI
jgi:hypothetical protein